MATSTKFSVSKKSTLSRTMGRINKRKQRRTRPNSNKNFLTGPLVWRGSELTEAEYVHHLTPEQIHECEKSMREFKGAYRKCMKYQD